MSPPPSRPPILWIFFIVSALQPVIKQRDLEASRQRLIARIERQGGSWIILLVHREETMSLLGCPVFRYIDINDSEQVIRAIHMTAPDVPIDLVFLSESEDPHRQQHDDGDDGQDDPGVPGHTLEVG